MLKGKEDWKNYKTKLQTTSTTERINNGDNNARIQLEQELTRYDAKYKYITWHNNRRDNLSSQLY